MYGPPEYFARRNRIERDDAKKVSNPVTPPPPPPEPTSSVISESHPESNKYSSSEAAESKKASKSNVKFGTRYQIKDGTDDLHIEFAKDVAYRRPTVYKNIAPILVKHPDVVTDFNLLREKYGEYRIDMTILENNESKPPFRLEKMKFESFITTIYSPEKYGSSHYLQQRDLSTHFHGFLEEAGIAERGPNVLSSLISEDYCHPPTFYIGNRGIRTSLHYDRSCDASSPDHRRNDPGKHNLFLQVSGSRKFVLFPSHYSEDLLPDRGHKWPHVSESTTFVHSVLDNCRADDLEQQLEYIRKSPYPTLANAWPERIEITLLAGETLLIPARWWHYTEILEAGCALNWWFLVDDSLESKVSKVLADEKHQQEPFKDRKCLIS